MAKSFETAALVVTLAFVTSSCTAQQNSKRGTPVPAVAPTTTPRALFDSLGLLYSPDGHGVPVLRSIVTIAFKDGTGQKDRQAAIDAIRGEVVGGYRWMGSDGEYYVRIAGTTLMSIDSAVTTLSRFRQVDYAFPVAYDTLSQSPRRRPNRSSTQTTR